MSKTIVGEPGRSSTHKHSSWGAMVFQGVLVVLLLAAGGAIAAERPTAAQAPARCPEDLGYDVFEGQSNRIARVSIATPTSVWVIYEGGAAGRNIPRQDLPPQLRAKYPYDPARIAEARQKQIERAAEDRAAWGEAVRLRGQELQAQIAALQREIVEIQREANVLSAHMRGTTVRGNGRLVRLAQLRARREAIELHILGLKRQIEQLHAR